MVLLFLLQILVVASPKGFGGAFFVVLSGKKINKHANEQNYN